MPLCASVPATVDTDLNQHSAYLTDLDKCMKTFNDALTATMNAYRQLLSAFDQVGQVYGNVSQTCSNEVNGPVKEFRDGMRELKDKGGFETFNREIHDGAMAAMDPVKQDLKKAMKTLKEVKARQKEYDTVRYDLDKTEKSYSKKDKPLGESKGYQKNLGKREKTKEAFDAKRAQFSQEIESLQSSTDKRLLSSLNHYLHCTATFCGQLEATMTGYRTDTNGSSTANMTSMDRLKEKAQVESSTRQAKRSSNINSQRHSQANSQGRIAASNASVGDDDDFYPKKEKRSADGSYPNEEAPRKTSEAYPNEERPQPQYQSQQQSQQQQQRSPKSSEAYPSEEPPQHQQQQPRKASDDYPTEEPQQQQQHQQQLEKQSSRKSSDAYPTEEEQPHHEKQGSADRYPEEEPGPQMDGHNPFSLNAQ